jgi:AraC-like DNA-binding protein
VPTENLESLGASGAAASREQFSVVRAAELSAFEVFDVRNSFRAWKVFHTVYDFCVPNRVVRRGEQRWSYRGRDYEGSGVSTMIMEPGEVHRTTKVMRPADFYVLRVDPTALAGLTAELGSKPLHFRLGQMDDRAAHRAVTEVAAELCHGTADPLFIESKLLQFLRRALAVGGESRLRLDPKPCKQAADRVRQYIHGSYAERVTLDEIAAACDRTKWHLARSFHELVGVTIHEYLTLVRLAHAQRLLRTGVRPSIAATEVGFADQAHLTRSLRRNLGITPGRYRRA